MQQSDARMWRSIRCLVQAIGVVGIVVALAAAEAAAQCALCGQGTPFAGSSPRRSILTFLAAALVLLLPTFGAAAAVARTLWRHRDPR